MIKTVLNREGGTMSCSVRQFFVKELVDLEPDSLHTPSVIKIMLV